MGFSWTGTAVPDRSTAERIRFNESRENLAGNHGRMTFVAASHGPQKQKNAASPKGSGVFFDRDA
jgi:hypothetical protein